jgi:dihydroneopterin aldolase
MSFRTRVGIADLEIDCVIGANSDERDREQAVLISFEIEYGAGGVGSNADGPGDRGGAVNPGGRGRDELDAAVDYADAAARIRRIARQGRYVLLETLARAVAEELSRDERVAALTVECRKPGALADAAYACARVTWARD